MRSRKILNGAGQLILWRISKHICDGTLGGLITVESRGSVKGDVWNKDAVYGRQLIVSIRVSLEDRGENGHTLVYLLVRQVSGTLTVGKSREYGQLGSRVLHPE